MIKHTYALLLLLAALLLGSCAGSAPPGSAGSLVNPGKATRVIPSPPQPTRTSPEPGRPAGPVSLEPTAPAPAEIGIADRAEVRDFIAEMSRKHGFQASELQRLFENVAIQPAILAAIAKPYETKPWYAYRKLFLTEKRINGGREFRSRHAAAFAAAGRRYGVAPDIIAAILGIESSYGQNPGKYRVVDALSTLAFKYPRRASFFRQELVEFLRLCREEAMDPLRPMGSYAGAMGMPQFMPSSYRRLAADGDGDGKRDIWSNPADAIASVARYFAANGWRTGEPIAAPATVHGNAYPRLASRNLKPAHILSQLAALGVEPDSPVPGHLKGALVQLDGETGPAYWIAFPNFSVVMRYNHSPLYAMAAYELSRALVSGRSAAVSPQ